MQNAPPGIQQAHPAWNSTRQPATKSYVVVAVNTDKIPHNIHCLQSGSILHEPLSL
jgi:hypothetical protein